tara:strand:+ start:45 stop:638 length:594 start_codon:yes stop_codon:yes gene_type:complete
MIGVQGNEAAQARVFAHDAVNIVVGAINWSATSDTSLAISGGITITSGGNGGANPYVVGDEITLTVGSGTDRAVFVVKSIDSDGKVTNVEQKYNTTTMAYSSGAAYTVGYAATQHATTSTAGTGFTATVNDIDIPNTQQRGVCVYIGASTGIATLTVIMESGRQAVFNTLSAGTVLPILIKRVTGGISATNDVLALY